MLALLPEGTRVTGVAFVLTEPGSYPHAAGTGWYQVGSPQLGWAYAPSLLDVRTADCSLRPSTG